LQLLAESDDAQFQLDILKGMSEAKKGRAGWPCPQLPAAAEVEKAQRRVRQMAIALSFFGDPATTEKLKKSSATDRRGGRAKKALADLVEAKQKDLPLPQN
jgi:hypothetical protein